MEFKRRDVRIKAVLNGSDSPLQPLHSYRFFENYRGNYTDIGKFTMYCERKVTNFFSHHAWRASRGHDKIDYIAPDVPTYNFKKYLVQPLHNGLLSPNTLGLLALEYQFDTYCVNEDVSPLHLFARVKVHKEVFTSVSEYQAYARDLLSSSSSISIIIGFYCDEHYSKESIGVGTNHRIQYTNVESYAGNKLFKVSFDVSDDRNVQNKRVQSLKKLFGKEGVVERSKRSMSISVYTDQHTIVNKLALFQLSIPYVINVSKRAARETIVE